MGSGGTQTLWSPGELVVGVVCVHVGWALKVASRTGKQRQRIGENEVVALARVVHNNRFYIAYNPQ